jgi:GT2 family glycosyltransferase
MTHTPATPVLSICIANYNGAGLLDECLESVFAQHADLSFEVLVHDDASTDDSVSRIRAKFDSVRIIESRDNVGFCVANNRMAAAANGRYLLLLNNDATLRPGSIAAFAAAAARLPDAILGLPQCARHDGKVVDHGYGFDLFMNPIPRLAPGEAEVETVTGACLWVPRPTWQTLGGFPEWFESVAEDIYLCQAARLLGFPVRMLAGPPFDHWIGASLGGGKVVAGRLGSTTRRRALSERNKTAVLLVCDPPWALLLLLPLHALLLAAEAASMWITGTRRDKVSRIYGGVLPWLLEQRGHIAALRRTLRSRRRTGDLAFMRRFHMVPQKLRLLLRHGFPRVD